MSPALEYTPTLQITPLDSIREEIRSSLPFNAQNAKLAKFIRDPAPAGGEFFLCVDREDSEKDVIFRITGKCTVMKQFALAPRVVPTARRSPTVRVDRYNIRIILTSTEAEIAEHARDGKLF